MANHLSKTVAGNDLSENRLASPCLPFLLIEHFGEFFGVGFAEEDEVDFAE